jgi:hypothetical protein
MKCHELAKHDEFAFLSEFYRRHAVRYMFMALNEARARGEITSEDDRRAVASGRPLGISAIGRP